MSLKVIKTPKLSKCVAEIKQFLDEIIEKQRCMVTHLMKLSSVDLEVWFKVNFEYLSSKGDLSAIIERVTLLSLYADLKGLRNES